MCSEEDLVRAMVSNPNYGRLAAASNMIDNMLAQGKQAMKDMQIPVFGAEQTTLAMSTRDLGYDTVSLAYAMHQMFKKIPEIKVPRERNKAVETLEKHLGEKGFTMCEPVKKKLASLRVAV